MTLLFNKFRKFCKTQLEFFGINRYSKLREIDPLRSCTNLQRHLFQM